MSRWLPWSPAILAAVLVLALVVPTVLLRLPYPYDLEWMEGGVLAHAWRLQQGLPIYGPPDLDFISFVYPPGYSALLALLGGVLGLGPTVGRAISVISTVASGGIIALIVARHGAGPARWVAGPLAAVVFVGTWLHSGGFMDLVRPDALGLALLLAATALALERRRAHLLAAGLVLFLAFVVKQHTAAWGVPLALLILARSGWRDALWFGLPSAAAGLLFTVGMTGWSGGHYWNYLFVVPASHPFVHVRAWPGSVWEWGTALPVALPLVAGWALWRGVRPLKPRTALLVAAVSLVLALVAALIFSQSGAGSGWSSIGEALGTAMPTSRGIQSRGTLISAVATASLVLLAGALVAGVVSGCWRRWTWVGLASAGIVTVVICAVMRGHQGGYLNVHMPLHALVALGTGLAAADLASQRPARSMLVPLAVSLVIAGQLLSQASALVHLDSDKVWPWQRWAPDAADRQAGDRVVQQIAMEDGPVWSPFAPWLPTYAGHPPSSHLIGLWDVDTDRHPTGPYADANVLYRHAIETNHWHVIIDSRRGTGYDVQDHYPFVEAVPALPNAFRTQTGWPVRPILLRRPTEPGQSR